MKKTILTLSFTMCACIFSAQTAVSDKDRDFAQKAAMANLAEIRLGELAQSKATTPEVKTLGKHMVDDHTKAYNDLKALAAKKNITIAGVLDEKNQKNYDNMMKKQGNDFDKAYTKCMVKDHKKDICLFRKESKKGDDADLKTWATNSLPTLEHHKQMSKDACKAVKKST